MKAWTHNSRGPPSTVLKLQHDFPQPTETDLKPHEVLIKVSHVALFAPNMQLMAVLPHLNSNPWIPETQFSGTVVALGSELGKLTGVGDAVEEKRRVSVGDAVFGMINPKKGGYNGVLAEYIVAPLESVVRKPRDVSMSEAAGFGGGGCTVIGFAERTGLIEVRGDGTTSEPWSIVNKAHGGRILVTGGSTGTGQFMLQLARMLVGDKGAVVTTASPRNADHVKKFGADEVIDYTTHTDLHKYLSKHYSMPSTPFDVIIDISGSDPLLYKNSPSYLREDGYFVAGGNMSRTHAQPSDASFFSAIIWIFFTVGMVLSWLLKSIWPVVLGGVPRKFLFHSGVPDARNLELVRQLVEEGKLKSSVDSVWEMDDLLKAYEHLAEGKITGKVIIKVER